MKKYLLLGTSLMLASSAYATFDCTKIPTCADLGFTMSITDCQGKQILRCPREPDNDNRVFCGGDDDGCREDCKAICDYNYGLCEPCYDASGNQIGGKCRSFDILCDGFAKTTCEYGIKEVCDASYEYVKCYTTPPQISECKIGSILFKNSNNEFFCYDRETAKILEKETPIAVVFDTENRLAVGLNQIANIAWSSAAEDTPLPNYNTEEKALVAKETGKENTEIIVKLGGDYASSDYAPGYCYNLTDGGQPVGSWFLPSLKELQSISDNEDTLQIAIGKAGGRALFRQYVFWSSTENMSTHAWSIYQPDNNDILRLSKTESNYFVLCAIAY